jgi:hypothetical protein
MFPPQERVRFVLLEFENNEPFRSNSGDYAPSDFLPDYGLPETDPGEGADNRIRQEAQGQQAGDYGLAQIRRARCLSHRSKGEAHFFGFSDDAI